MSKSRMLAALIPLWLAGNMMGDGTQDIRPEDIDVKPKEKPVPKGCRRYFFNAAGRCSEGSHEVYFDCLKDKTAYKKFDKWKSTLNPHA